MSRRVSLPGADELFRSTSPLVPAPLEPEPAVESTAPPPAPTFAERDPEDDEAPMLRRRPRPAGERRPTGRERHEEKITVYCSADELIELERARLTLRGDHGVAIDRGRIVREALAVVLSDLDAKGDQSILVRRLRGGR